MLCLAAFRAAVGLLLLGLLSGCNSFGNARLVKELQAENERLLSEFRAQRDRASELEKANQLQAQRLAESEKLLARLSQTGGAGRISSLPPFGIPPTTGSNPVGGNSAESNGTLGGAASGAEGTELRWQPRYESR